MNRRGTTHPRVQGEGRHGDDQWPHDVLGSSLITAWICSYSAPRFDRSRSARELFTRWRKTETKAESQAKEADVFQHIGKLQMEPEWSKNFQQLWGTSTPQTCRIKPRWWAQRQAPVWVLGASSIQPLLSAHLAF